MRVSIVVATYGDERWRDLAAARAVPSAIRQDAHEVVVEHQPGGTIGSARNEAALRATGDWLCFLDGDDELEGSFLHQIRRARERDEGPDGPVLVTPAVSYVRAAARRKVSPPRIWPECSLERGNWLVIGTVVPRWLFAEVGGFKDYGDPPGTNAFEDWALWARCANAGARVVKAPRAVYLAHWDDRSRHRGVDRSTRIRWHYEIGRDLFPDLYPESWLAVHDVGASPTERALARREARLAARRRR